jgi:pimeloyl-ACP methyl ester carboxylesterase
MLPVTTGLGQRKGSGPRLPPSDDGSVMSHAELDGVRLYYERAGEGDPELLFVHGWCYDRTAFQPQFDYFAQAHPVTALDLRGCGLSDQPESGYGIPDFAHDLAQFCAAVAVEKPVVVGHSLGGMIGIELAARHPSVPRALVLVDPGPIDPLPATVKAFSALAAHLAPDHVAGVHFTQLYSFPSGDPAELAELTPEEQRELETLQWFMENKFSFNTLMSQQPQTLAFALLDSPAGLLAWNAQLLGEDLDPDFVLANVALYWLTATAAARLYYENAHRRPSRPASRSAWLPSLATSAASAASPSATTPTSFTGRPSTAAATSPRTPRPTCSPTTCARSSAPCAPNCLMNELDWRCTVPSTRQRSNGGGRSGVRSVVPH